jgi:hypothetical protein
MDMISSLVAYLQNVLQNTRNGNLIHIAYLYKTNLKHINV